MLALIQLSMAGVWNRGLMDEIVGWFRECGIEVRKVDTVAGWWNLNQDWYELECEVETAWDHVRPKCLRDDLWEELFNHLHFGNVIMQVHYVSEKDGKREYISHC